MILIAELHLLSMSERGDAGRTFQHLVRAAAEFRNTVRTHREVGGPRRRGSYPFVASSPGRLPEPTWVPYPRSSLMPSLHSQTPKLTTPQQEGAYATRELEFSPWKFHS